MMKEPIRISIYLLLFFTVNLVSAQPGQNVQPQEGGFRPDETTTTKSQVVKKIKNWRLINDYTIIDSIPVDTFLNGFQISNPVFKQNPFNISTGNYGGPYQSNSLEFLKFNQDFIFTNSLDYFFSDPSTYRFYNTTVPYTNLSYSNEGPKRRSEENTRVLFTQNINPDWNFGVSYNLISSIGKYLGQRQDNQRTQLFMSYKGDKYSVHGALSYNDIRHLENGGISNDTNITHPERYDNIEAENIKVHFNNKRSDAANYLKNYQIFIHQSLGLGRLKLKETDTSDIQKELPIGTVYHTLKFDSKRRVYKVNNLNSYYDDDFYSNYYIDSLRTKDSTRLNQLKNTFQIRFNEEANSLFKFGVRAFIENELDFYKVNQGPYNFYKSTDTLITASAIGGQIFKTLGKNLWWNAGAKLYFQGYRIGDSEITGNLETLFRIKNDTAGFFANGGIYLQSPGLLFTKYFSNHIQWNKSFSPEKTLKVRGGITIPTRRFKVTAEIRLINDYFYWNNEALPDQESGVVQAYELKLHQHFILWNIHSRNIVSYQVTSKEEVLPLPTLSVFSSNYFENTLFKVLKFQLGFDVKYHTEYYAPSYFPATGQFYVQNDIKIGNYPFADVFLNFHLKRARLGVKYEHINKGYPENNYFLIPHYAANPGGVKICVSWNFFD